MLFSRVKNVISSNWGSKIGSLFLFTFCLKTLNVSRKKPSHSRGWISRLVSWKRNRKKKYESIMILHRFTIAGLAMPYYWDKMDDVSILVLSAFVRSLAKVFDGSKSLSGLAGDTVWLNTTWALCRTQSRAALSEMIPRHWRMSHSRGSSQDDCGNWFNSWIW